MVPLNAVMPENDAPVADLYWTDQPSTLTGSSVGL
jgi:hypothetical protein